MHKSNDKKIKLQIHKTTVRRLLEDSLRQVAGADYVSLLGCSWGCDPNDSVLFASCYSGGRTCCGEEA